MKEDTRILSIIAYYLSKYDIEGVRKLGYTTRSAALQKLSALFGHPNAYLKLRRDEFDVLTGSSRKGWRNREPASDVLKLASFLENYDFDELTEIIQQYIVNQASSSTPNSDISGQLDEESIESLLNSFDSNAEVASHTGTIKTRHYNTNSIKRLKEHYHHKCQICGINPGAPYNADLAEVHHIVPFAKKPDNTPSNLIVLCPNHHRLFHKLQASFDADAIAFISSDGYSFPLTLNDHL